MKKRDDSKKEKKKEPEKPIVCPCGSRDVIWIHSHYQCAKCGRILHSCCEGEQY